jgi:hypothetical protein
MSKFAFEMPMAAAAASNRGENSSRHHDGALAGAVPNLAAAMPVGFRRAVEPPHNWEP